MTEPQTLKTRRLRRVYRELQPVLPRLSPYRLDNEGVTLLVRLVAAMEMRAERRERRRR